MSKQFTILTLSLLLCFGLIYASRPNVAFEAIFSQHGDVAAAKAELDDESCEGGIDGNEREECLMRRTLAAHVDYIYTQKHKPRN